MLFNNRIFFQILRRSVRLFHRDLLRSTSIMLVIYFCLSFGLVITSHDYTVAVT